MCRVTHFHVLLVRERLRPLVLRRLSGKLSSRRGFQGLGGDRVKDNGCGLWYRGLLRKGRGWLDHGRLAETEDFVKITGWDLWREERGKEGGGVNEECAG